MKIDVKGKFFVGIDPGKNGAIAILAETGEVLLTSTFPMIGNDYDLYRFSEFLNQIPKNSHTVLEDVQPNPRGSNKSNWTFSRGKTIWEMGLVMQRVPFTMVAPRTWQKEIHKGTSTVKDPKIRSLLAVQRIFPGTSLKKNSKSGVVHDGIVDALCLAEYGRRKYR